MRFVEFADRQTDRQTDTPHLLPVNTADQAGGVSGPWSGG